LRATQTSIGKGTQQLRDIPQSITVVTEKLIDDRNLDTMKEALKNTGGVSFLAAEGGEEDIRLRGFALPQRATCLWTACATRRFMSAIPSAWTVMEVMRGSASMLFGRGSTGGAVNQVNKVPRLIDEQPGGPDAGQPSRNDASWVISTSRLARVPPCASMR
jgi:catecholate siderophore receptor